MSYITVVTCSWEPFEMGVNKLDISNLNCFIKTPGMKSNLGILDYLDSFNPNCFIVTPSERGNAFDYFGPTSHTQLGDLVNITRFCGQKRPQNAKEE
eukprot:1190632-Ditylum_brightwellii.AAC.1